MAKWQKTRARSSATLRQLPRRADDPGRGHISWRTHRDTVFTAKEYERESTCRQYMHQRIFEDSTRPDLQASYVYRYPSLRRNVWCLCNLRWQATCRVDGHDWDPRPTMAESRDGFVLVIWKGLYGNNRLPQRFLRVRLPTRHNLRNSGRKAEEQFQSTRHTAHTCQWQWTTVCIGCVQKIRTELAVWARD